MKPQEMWNTYKQINPSIGDEIDAWAFGVEADLLADLVLKGEKTATASAYDLYALEDEPLPQEGTFDIILDSQNQAVCIVLLYFCAISCRIIVAPQVIVGHLSLRFDSPAVT